MFAMLVASPATAGSAQLKRASDGHWWADARVNGRPIKMMVDTGASMVALTKDDARRIGLDVRNLRYDVRVRTASGNARAADVMLERLDVGTVRIANVPAMVMEGGLSTSLLGMSWLGKLEQVQVRGDVMHLRD
jgi:aspartyl protease family protein